ncbi:sulfur-carrier protein adenylyltransferase/sulfurtransferase [Nematocida homosporus]|uniref:sulfur-carrier protein adenylyltransferase/sulfurtransferase n=1 Tax=Nematocida homosporus TaxID=1912981 RepID=UPI002220C524|nr:sulfur-carrier protein adenylyltransferase/sulfurtransferase [Nematocida homosporus]KAI5185597.1 sulfur-carrier protein adenylyltransferase/sulfurtransferase [Nematocida homosporus]
MSSLDGPLELVSRLAQYERQMIVAGIGQMGQERLEKSRVLVVGCGGLGSPVLLYLAAMGVGCLGVADDDKVEISNLNRQILFGMDSIGRSKTEVARERILGCNKRCRVIEHGFITRANVWQIGGGYDLVVDCADSRMVRYLLSDYCAARGIPFICGSSLRWEGSVYLFKSMCYRCVYPKLSSRRQDTCASAGMVGPMCGIVGSAMSLEVAKVILGREKQSYMLHVDGARNDWLRVNFGSKPPCVICQKKDSLTLREIRDWIDDQSDLYYDPDQVGLSCPIPGMEESGPILTPSKPILNTQPNLKHTITWGEVLAELPAYYLVDIRTPQEYQLFSHPQASSYPLGQLIDNPAKATTFLRQQAKNKQLVIFCRNGSTARKFAPLLGALNIHQGIQQYLTLLNSDDPPTSS